MWYHILKCGVDRYKTKLSFQKSSSGLPRVATFLFRVFSSLRQKRSHTTHHVISQKYHYPELLIQSGQSNNLFDKSRSERFVLKETFRESPKHSVLAIINHLCGKSFSTKKNKFCPRPYKTSAFFFVLEKTL